LSVNGFLVHHFLICRGSLFAAAIGLGFVVPFAFGAALAAVGALLVATQVYDPEISTDETGASSGQAAPQD
jgi:hypothetical protein